MKRRSPASSTIGSAIAGYRSERRERLRGFSRGRNQILANDFVASGGRQLVTISAGDAGFHTDDQCGTWTRVQGATTATFGALAQSAADIERMRALNRDGDVRNRRVK